MKIYADTRILLSDGNIVGTEVVEITDSTSLSVLDVARSIVKGGGFLTRDEKVWVPYHRIIKITED